MLTEQDFIDQREQMQEDISCILDGMEDEYIDNCCQVIVDRIQILLDKFQQA